MNVEGSLSFTGSKEEQKNAAITVIIGFMEQFDIDSNELEY